MPPGEDSATNGARETPRSRVLLVCELDDFANGLKPVEIERFLRDRGHDVRIANAMHLSRASNVPGSVGSKLPALSPRKFALYLIQLASLLLTRRWRSTRRRLSYYLIRADCALRRSSLASSFPLDEFDMIICEHPADSELMLVPTSARKLYDCMTPWADELYHEGMLTEKQHLKLRRREAEIMESVDLLSFSWETYAPYSLAHYGISGGNFLQLNWGCTPATERARYSDPPRVVLLSSLSSNFINLPLLSRLSKLYPIDVYGGPEPDPALGLNYLGWAPPSVLRDYQIGLITCSTDELRRHGFSAKNLQYIAHGLPVLVPAWRRHMHLLRGSVPYEEETFLSAVEALSDEREWHRVGSEAYAQATELTWDKTLQPLEAALQDPSYRYATPHMQAALEARSPSWLAARRRPRTSELTSTVAGGDGGPAG